MGRNGASMEAKARPFLGHPLSDLVLAWALQGLTLLPCVSGAGRPLQKPPSKASAGRGAGAAQDCPVVLSRKGLTAPPSATCLNAVPGWEAARPDCAANWRALRGRFPPLPLYVMFFCSCFLQPRGDGWGSPARVSQAASLLLAPLSSAGDSVQGQRPRPMGGHGQVPSPALLLALRCPGHQHRLPAAARGCCQLRPAARPSLSAPLCTDVLLCRTVWAAVVSGVARQRAGELEKGVVLCCCCCSSWPSCLTKLETAAWEKGAHPHHPVEHILVLLEQAQLSQQGRAGEGLLALSWGGKLEEKASVPLVRESSCFPPQKHPKGAARQDPCPTWGGMEGGREGLLCCCPDHGQHMAALPGRNCVPGALVTCSLVSQAALAAHSLCQKIQSQYATIFHGTVAAESLALERCCLCGF